jgi:hypothetical protein
MDMTIATFICARCGVASKKELGAVNRAKRNGRSLYCSRVCSGLGRRKNKTDEQRKIEKSQYDALRRLLLHDEIKAKKAAAYLKNRNPEAEKRYRELRKDKHAAYIKRPRYVSWKREYDIQRRGMDYGEFAECHRLLIDLEREIRTQMPRYEIYKLNGRIDRMIERKRQRRLSNV